MMNSAGQSDEALVTAAKAGDRDALGTLVARYEDLVCTIAYSRIRDLEAAQDVAQDAFLASFEALPTLRAPSKYGGWLARITRKLCDNWHRSERYRRALFRHISERARLDRTPGPEDALEAKETRATLRAAIDALPLRLRETLILHYFRGRSTAECARILGISQEAVWKRLSRSKIQIRDYMTAEVERALTRARAREDFPERTLAAVPVGSLCGKLGLDAARLGWVGALQGAVRQVSTVLGGGAVIMASKKAIVATGAAALVLMIGGAAVYFVSRPGPQRAHVLKPSAYEDSGILRDDSRRADESRDDQSGSGLPSAPGAVLFADEPAGDPDVDVLVEKLGEWNSGWAQTIPHKFLEDDKNAFNGYLRAATLLAPVDSDPRFAEAWELILSKDFDWVDDPEKLALVEAYLAASAEAITVLKEAIQESDYYRGLPNYLGPATDMPYLMKFRDVAVVLRAEAMVLHAQGHTGAAVNDALALMEMGKDVGSGESQGQAIVGLAIRAYGELCIPHLISRVRDASICQEVMDAARTALSDGFAYSSVLRSDLDGFVNMVSHPEYLRNVRESIGVVSWLPDCLVHAGQLSDEQVWEELGQLEATLHQYMDGFDKPYPEFMSTAFAQIDPNWTDFWLTEELYRDQKKIVTKEEARLGACQILAGLKLYQLQTGVFPDNLEQLVPTCLPALPDDPFSSQAFGYMKAGSGAVIYSVGPDMKDDHAEKRLRGGVGEGDIVFRVE